MLNERIENIARQCMSMKFFVDTASEEFDYNKFAELLIKEFETVAKQPPHYYDAPSCGWRNPIDYVCRSVKEHFGVEE